MAVVNMTNSKLVYGVGNNDADYVTRHCKIYNRWRKMLDRAYNHKRMHTDPTYNMVEVCSEWLTFSKFRKWMVKHDWQGKELDKDIVRPKNKIYSPETCVFIPQHLNTLITNCQNRRGPYPIGVSLHKGLNRFQSAISKHKKRIHLGFFDTPEEAAQAYNQAKHDHLLEIAAEQSDERVANGLRLHAKLYLEGKVK